MFAFVLGGYFPDIDFKKAMQMCLIHDLGEAYEGDVSAKLEADQENKLKREEKAMLELSAPLPESIQNKILGLWREYNGNETREAKFVKAIDKMETILQHNQGNNPADFDYVYNLEYGKEYSFHDPVLREIREIIDEETSEKAKKAGYSGI